MDGYLCTLRGGRTGGKGRRSLIIQGPRGGLKSGEPRVGSTLAQLLTAPHTGPRENGHTVAPSDAASVTSRRGYYVMALAMLVATLAAAAFCGWAFLGLDTALDALLAGGRDWSPHQTLRTGVTPPGGQDGQRQEPQVVAPADVVPPAGVYAKAHLTNAADETIAKHLDDADRLLDSRRGDEALSKFKSLLARHPGSARAQWGKAAALDILSEVKRNNHLLEQSIAEYEKVLEVADVPRELALMAGRRAADRMGFRGWMVKAAQLMKRLSVMYPSMHHLQNEVGIKYLMAGRAEDSRRHFTQVLALEPGNAVAMAHLGFIVKTTDNDPAGAAPLLQAALDTEEAGTVDGRFYFQLGDSYTRLGKTEEARAAYRKGAELGVFRSEWQRSLYNVDSLQSRPWWTLHQTRQADKFKMLEQHWREIAREAVANLDAGGGAFVPEEENLRETGDWQQFTLWARGRKNEAACRKAPKTCALLDKIPEATSCTRGQIKFSIMQPGVHVWPHCGPTNCRIRAHLGLVVPPGPRIRVTDDVRTWEEGKVIVFDDSFEHEVWHDGASRRMVLIVDIWHPDLTDQQKRTLAPI